MYIMVMAPRNKRHCLMQFSHTAIATISISWLGTELSPGQRPAKNAVGLPIVTHCLYCFCILPKEIADKNGAGNVQTS